MEKLWALYYAGAGAEFRVDGGAKGFQSFAQSMESPKQRRRSQYQATQLACGHGPGLPERGQQLGDRLKARLESMRGEVPQIADVRGLGGMVAVEFNRAGTGDADGDADGETDAELEVEAAVARVATPSASSNVNTTVPKASVSPGTTVACCTRAPFTHVPLRDFRSCTSTVPASVTRSSARTSCWASVAYSRRRSPTSCSAPCRSPRSMPGR